MAARRIMLCRPLLLLLVLLLTGCKPNFSYSSKLSVVAMKFEDTVKDSARFSKNNSEFIFGLRKKDTFFFRSNAGQEWGPYDSIEPKYSGFATSGAGEFIYFTFSAAGKHYFSCDKTKIELPGNIVALEFLADGAPLIACSGIGEILLYEGRNWRRIQGTNVKLSVSPNRNRFVWAISGNSSVSLWSEKKLTVQNGLLLSFGISENSNWFLTTKDGNICRTITRDGKAPSAKGVFVGWPNIVGDKVSVAYTDGSKSFFWQQGKVLGPFEGVWKGGDDSKELYFVVRNLAGKGFALFEGDKVLLQERELDTEGPVKSSDGVYAISGTGDDGRAYFFSGLKVIGPFKSVGHTRLASNHTWYGIAAAISGGYFLVTYEDSFGPFESIEDGNVQGGRGGEIFFKAMRQGVWSLYRTHSEGAKPSGPGQSVLYTESVESVPEPFGIETAGAKQRLTYGMRLGKWHPKIVKIIGLEPGRIFTSFHYWAISDRNDEELEEIRETIFQP